MQFSGKPFFGLFTNIHIKHVSFMNTHLLNVHERTFFALSQVGNPVIKCVLSQKGKKACSLMTC